jgi:hypothetical protein
MIPFISWGAKWCSIQSLHIIILSRKNDFPNIQSLTMQILVQMHGLMCGQKCIRRLCARKTEEKERLRARCAPVDSNTHAPASKSPGRKSGSISLQFLMNWLLIRSAEAGLWTCKSVKSKGKKMKPKWGRNLYQLPSMVANLFALFSSLCEQKVSAYMPSWALLVMTAVW